MTTLRRSSLFLGAAAVLVLTACRSSSPWRELDSLDDLRAAFNADRGRARLVLLLSPT